MKTIAILALALLLSSCKIFSSATVQRVPDYYKIETSYGVVYEVKAIFQGVTVDMATGNSAVFLNDNYKITPVYVYGKSN
jgi:hypothetical protein